MPFETVFCAYRVYHTHETKSDDFVTRHKLQHAVEEAFLDGETLPLEAMFTAKDCLREKMISKQGAIDRRQDGLSHPHLSVPDPFRSAQKREKGAKEDPTNKGISRETVEDSYTDAQSIEGGRAEATAPRAEEAVARVAPNAAVVTEGGEEDGDRAGRPQGATTMEASSTRAERGAASTRGGGAEKFGVSARQRVGDGNADEEDDEGELENLARKWLDIKSGGAFARPQPQQRRRRKVDVLRWGV